MEIRTWEARNTTGDINKKLILISYRIWDGGN